MRIFASGSPNEEVSATLIREEAVLEHEAPASGGSADASLSSNTQEKSNSSSSEMVMVL